MCWCLWIFYEPVSDAFCKFMYEISKYNIQNMLTAWIIIENLNLRISNLAWRLEVLNYTINQVLF